MRSGCWQTFRGFSLRPHFASPMHPEHTQDGRSRSPAPFAAAHHFCRFASSFRMALVRSSWPSGVRRVSSTAVRSASWNCFICGLSCGLSRFLTNGFAEIVPASDGVPAVCEVGLFPSWMGGIRSQITRAANYATFGHRYFSRPRAFFPTYVRQYTLRSAALALWHHLLLDRGQHDGFILYLSILPVSPPKSSLFASGRYVGKAVRRLWGLRTA